MEKIKLVLIALLSLTISTISAQAGDDYTMVGKVNSYQRDANAIHFNCENGKVKLSILKSNLIRVQMVPKGEDFPADDLHPNENGPYAVVKYDWAPTNFSIKEEFSSQLEGEVYNVITDSLLITVKQSSFKLYYYRKDGTLLTKEKEGVNSAGLGYEGSKVFETMVLQQDEQFFGLGAYKNGLKLRGGKYRCYATELGEENKGGGFPVPWLMSSKGYGIFFNNIGDDVTFDLGKSDEVAYQFWGTNGKKEGWGMDYYFIYGPGMDKMLETYHEITGPAMLPEKWFFGHMQSRAWDWTDSLLPDVAKKYRELDLPLDVLIIDFQGINKNKFEWDSAFFKNPVAMYKKLEKYNIKTAISTALFRNFYDWKTYDPTNPQIIADYWNKHIPFMKDGNSFWWQDNAERFHEYSGKKNFGNGYQIHELFGSLWAKNIVDNMDKMGLYGRPVLSRAGAIGGHRYIIPWPGDIFHGLEKFTTDLDFVRNGAISGFPYITVDLGGFVFEYKDMQDFQNKKKDKMDEKLALEEQNVVRRMIDFVPIVPISRAHGDFVGAILPWDMTKQQQDIYRYYLKFRYRLFPYIYSAAIDAHLTGKPILAPLSFYHFSDKTSYDYEYEFMFGESFLAAPVLKKEVNQWEVYLPKGQWINYWTGQKFSGEQKVTISAKLYENESLPLFVKAGAIIPMYADRYTITDERPKLLKLDIYPEGNSNYTLLEKQSANPKDTVEKTKIECLSNKKDVVVEFDSKYEELELCLHLDKKPKEIFINDQKIAVLKSLNDFETVKEGWYYGTGVFYGSKTMKTINVKHSGVGKCKVRIVR